jgi:uncharacterized phage-associated protein
MAKALNVALYLIKIASAEDEPEFLTPLRLQKLLYYVQAWSLALHDKPLFDEDIQAWANGPVVKRVYQAFSDKGGTAIDPKDVHDPKDLTQEEQDFIGSVWESYKGYSAMSLRAMSHAEAPWIEARQGLNPAERSSNVITHASMKSYFSQLRKK